MSMMSSRPPVGLVLLLITSTHAVKNNSLFPFPFFQEDSSLEGIIRQHVLRHVLNVSEIEAQQLDSILDSLPDLITPMGDGVSPACLASGETYSKLTAGWALKMFDATAKLPPPGLFKGSFLHMPGNFDSCLEADSGTFRGKYCLLGVIDLPAAAKRQHRQLAHQARRMRQQQAQLTELEFYNRGVRTTDMLGLLFRGVVKLGHCVPSTCSVADVEVGFQNFLDGLLGEDSNAVAFAYNCHTAEESIPMETGDWVVGALILILLAVILIGTAIDIVLNVLQLDVFSDGTVVIFQGFSLIENTAKLFRVGPNKEGLGSINGIRFISMTWVILGHTYLKYATNNGFYNNFADIEPLYGESNWMAALRSAYFSVDTFFLIGATLLAYLTMKELDRSRGGGAKFWMMFYVHRYLRLTGVYAAVVALHATYLKFLATGPNSYTLSDTRYMCHDGWWLNLLYVNNFYEDIGREHCMGWSWYLANDMQMFVVSPLVIWPLWRWPRVGALWSGGLLVTATGLRLAREIQDYGVPEQAMKNFYEVYSKPWYRYQPYIIGLMLGAAFFHLRRRAAATKTTLEKGEDVKANGGNDDKANVSGGFTATISRPQLSIWIVLLGWALACLTGLWCVYGRAWAGREFAMLKAGTVMFESLSKVGWSLAVGWVIFACAEGKGGPVDWLLSWSGWVPLARLSYATYLVHFTVIDWVLTLPSYAIPVTHTLTLYYILANTAVSLALAYACVVVFEAPLLHLEKLLFAGLGVGRLPAVKKKLA